MSYTASLIDGTLVEIVDKVAEGQKTVLVDAEGTRYVASLHGSYITPVEVAEAVEEAVADDLTPVTVEPVVEPHELTDEEKAAFEAEAEAANGTVNEES